MLQYLAIETNHRRSMGSDERIIKGVYDRADIADQRVQNLYNESVKYNKSDTTYDTFEFGNYIETQEANGGGVETIATYQIIELEFEWNADCEISF